VQRIHGDLHLGQVLRTSQRWVFLDFEGEPAKSIEERRAPDSPLRDVAGMLRSFDYAANHQVIDSSPTPRATEHADEWAIRNRSAFCAGYADVSGRHPEEDVAVLAAYEADKAVYETVYEARNRPSWLPVPVASLGRIANREIVTEEER
jgi:maltokinase